VKQVLPEVGGWHGGSPSCFVIVPWEYKSARRRMEMEQCKPIISSEYKIDRGKIILAFCILGKKQSKFYLFLLAFVRHGAKVGLVTFF
jgi:hypothetical protein